VSAAERQQGFSFGDRLNFFRSFTQAQTFTTAQESKPPDVEIVQSPIMLSLAGRYDRHARLRRRDSYMQLTHAYQVCRVDMPVFPFEHCSEADRRLLTISIDLGILPDKVRKENHAWNALWTKACLHDTLSSPYVPTNGNAEPCPADELRLRARL